MAGLSAGGALVRLRSSDRGEGTGGCWSGVGLARCWVLREQPVGCCFGVASSSLVLGPCGSGVVGGGGPADRPGGVEPLSSRGGGAFGCGRRVVGVGAPGYRVGPVVA